ncbi:nitroreductase family protein [soil metagenome]
MQFADVVARRRMVRSYRPDPVDPAVLDRILDRASRAPSAGFSQPHRFVVVTSQRGRAAVAVACDEAAAVARGLRPWISVAPVLVLPCVERQAYVERYDRPDKSGSAGPAGWAVPFEWVDAGAAFMLLLLAAVDEGLGAGFLAADPDRLRAAVDVPAGWAPLGVVTIGHPAEAAPVGSAARRPRRPVAEMVRRV